MRPAQAFTLGRDHPSARLRLAVYQPYLRALGWDLSLHPFQPDMGKTRPRSHLAPLRWWHRLQRWQRTRQAVHLLTTLPAGTPLIISRELPVSLKPFLHTPQPLILDVDDALYLGSGGQRLQKLCRRAQTVVCGNATIAAAMRSWHDHCVIIPTVVDVERYEARLSYELAGPLRLGWLGSSMSFAETLEPALAWLEDICHQLKARLILIADEYPVSCRQRSWIQFIPWSPAVELGLAKHLDIGLMPLARNAYQSAKCGSKLLHYMAAGLPAIATPLGANCELVRPGETGFWAETPAEWHQAITRLRAQPDLRQQFGLAGRGHVQRNFSASRWAPNWRDVLAAVTAECPSR